MANQQEIKIKINDEQLKGSFANFMRVTHQKEEFVLDFAHIVPPQGIVVSRLIVTPAHLKQIVNALGKNLANYEQKFGQVEEAEERKTPLGFQA
jgi:hypothetical protein